MVLKHRNNRFDELQKPFGTGDEPVFFLRPKNCSKAASNCDGKLIHSRSTRRKTDGTKEKAKLMKGMKDNKRHTKGRACEKDKRQTPWAEPGCQPLGFPPHFPSPARHLSFRKLGRILTQDFLDGLTFCEVRLQSKIRFIFPSTSLRSTGVFFELHMNNMIHLLCTPTYGGAGLEQK